MPVLRSNLHLFLTTALNETRLFKEAANSIETGRFDHVEVVGIWESGLQTNEAHRSGLFIRRQKMVVSRLRARGWLEKRGLLRRLLAVFGMAEYLVGALRAAIAIKPTHISVHNLALLPAAMVIKAIVRSRIIYLPHELETERTGLNGTAKKIAAFVERHLIAHCNGIIVVCEPIADWYRQKYQLKNVRVVRNVPRAADITIASSEANKFRSQFGIPDAATIFIYQGLIDETRGVGALVQSFSGTDDHLILMGYGDFVAQLEALDQSNVHYQPAVATDQITTYTSSADVGLIVLDSRVSLSYEISLPNKFFEYLHAGLPVIVSESLGYVASLVRAHSLGWVTTAEQLPELIRTITPDDIRAFAAPVKHYATDCFWERDARAFDEVYT